MISIGEENIYKGKDVTYGIWRSTLPPTDGFLCGIAGLRLAGVGLTPTVGFADIIYSVKA